MFLTLPLWKKVRSEGAADGGPGGRDLSLLETIRIPGVKSMCCVFFIICAVECTCSGWGSTFLVEYRHLAADEAARVILLYFVGMAVGRFLSGVLAARMHSWTIIKISLWVLGAAHILLFIPGPVFLCTAGFFLIGLGIGPLFPNFNYLAPESFGEDVSQAVIGLQMSFAYAGIMLAPPVCSILGQMISMAVFPFYLLGFYVVMVAVTIFVKRLLKRQGELSGF